MVSKILFKRSLIYFALGLLGGVLFLFGLYVGARCQKDGSLGRLRLKVETALSSERARIRNVGEPRLLEQLDQAEPPGLGVTNPRFGELLRSALGWNRMIASETRIGAPGSGGLEGHWTGGDLREVEARFSFPPVSTRGLLAFHESNAQLLIVYLHGHYSSADKVVKVSLGKDFYLAGHDVLSLDLTSERETSSYLNAQLSLWGAQLYGLWVKGACEMIRAVRKQRSYERVAVYGFSNGGIIADYVSVLCDPVDLVVVDDIVDRWTQVLWRNREAHLRQQYSVYYLAPLLSQSSVLDFLRESASPKIYTRFPEVFESTGVKRLLESEYRLEPWSTPARHKVLMRTNPAHAPLADRELQLLLEGKPPGSMAGYALVPR